jgi:hypothetical protein
MMFIFRFCLFKLSTHLGRCLYYTGEAETPSNIFRYFQHNRFKGNRLDEICKRPGEILSLCKPGLPLAHPNGMKIIQPRAAKSARPARIEPPYPQQLPDLLSSLAPAGVDRNFCRQWSLQK